VLQFPCVLAILPAEEGHSDARLSGAASAADAMDPVFAQERELKVHDVLDTLDVQPARSHVGAHQQGHLAALELLHRLVARGLVLVAVDTVAAPDSDTSGG